MEGPLHNIFCKTSITLIPKADKGTRKENCRSTLVQKCSTKYQQMKFSNILKGLNTKSKWNLFIPGLQGLFNIGALINIKHHINRMKEKKYDYLSWYKNSIPFHDKSIQKTSKRKKRPQYNKSNILKKKKKKSKYTQWCKTRS